MKKLLLLSFAGAFLLFSAQLRAAGGPDAYGYTWKNNLDPGGPVFSWIDITVKPGVQTVTGLADDNSATAMAPIGFNFHYYWNDVSQVRIGSNGWLSFNSSVSNIASCFPNIPAGGGPADNYLAALMSDLNFTGVGNPGQVKYWSNNIDTFIVSFLNVPYWTVNAPGWTGSNTFQVILCGSDSSIYFQYGTLSAFTNSGACNDMEVGIENSTGTIGLQVYTDAMPTTDNVYHFIPPVVPLISIQDVTPVWNVNTGNRSEIILAGVPYALKSDIRNAGNANVTTSIALQATVANLVPSTVFTASGSLPGLAAGDDSVYTFSPSWTPATAGPYSLNVTLSNSQDINSANNSNVTELDVVNPCVSSMNISYVSSTTPTASINWNGGANDDGAAVYFQPPVAPYTINTLQYFITANSSNGYIATIYDDDGPNGGPGTVLFTVTVPSSSVSAGNWNTVTVSPAVTIPSGGYYVAWFQGGTTIFLGCETTGPFSHRNYEILDNGWATFRYSETQDLCIRSSISGFQGMPTAGFTGMMNGPLSFAFTDTSSGLATSWSWDFGDGNTSTLQDPSHTYGSPGVYNVCLIATSPCGSDTICQQVIACQTPAASFSSTTNGLSVNFTDLSTNLPTSWFWDFGDGNNSTAQNPVATYTASGTYTVCLVATTACGSDTSCQIVTVCEPVLASFSSTDTLGTVNFTDLSTGGASSWLWDFGDGNNSTAQNPVYTYTVPGTYLVCLTASSGCSSDSSCFQLNIVITGMHENTGSPVQLYPNPVSDALLVQLPAGSTEADIIVSDMTGRIVRSERHRHAASVLLDVHDLPAGVYQLQVRNLGSNSRFIKK